MVIALAGRRIDITGSEPPRFPEKNIALVKQRIKDFFSSEQVTALVSSAACGSDLIALDVAAELGIPGKIILPSDRNTFKTTSVTDRPGNWGDEYERYVNNGFEVIELHLEDVDGSSYTAASTYIIEEAQKISSSHHSPLPVVALVVWEGSPRSETDFTAGFAQEARNRNIEVKEISTL